MVSKKIFKMVLWISLSFLPWLLLYNIPDLECQREMSSLEHFIGSLSTFIVGFGYALGIFVVVVLGIKKIINLRF